MLDTIILLTGQAEQKALATVLRRHNPEADIWSVATADELATLQPAVLRRARLIAFVTPVVVPRSVLDQLGYGAYNFHPGPPHYPGWAPANFAIYHQATEFGVTAHVMTERVDAGPIVGVELFCIPPEVTLIELDRLALVHIARLFWELAKTLATRSAPLDTIPVHWSGRKTSRRQYAAMCDIPLDISEGELERRIKAFGGNFFDMSPAINLHGVQFRLMANGTSGSVMQTEFATIAQSPPARQVANA